MRLNSVCYIVIYKFYNYSNNMKVTNCFYFFIIIKEAKNENQIRDDVLQNSAVF